LGLRLETVRIHFLLGDLFQHDGQAAEAARQYQQAQSLLDGIQREAGAEHLSERFDLRRWNESANKAIATR
jgi:hypothetical protein